MSRYMLRAGLVLLDLSCLVLAFWLGWLTRFHVLPRLLPELIHVQQPWSLYLGILAPAGLSLILFAARAGLYQFGHTDRRRQIYGTLQAVAWLMPVVLAWLLIFQQSYEFSRLGTLFALAWLMLLLPAARILAFHLINKSGLMRAPTLIIGSPSRVAAFLAAVGNRQFDQRHILLASLAPGELLDESGMDFLPDGNALVDRLVRDAGLQKVIVFMEGLPRKRLTTVLRKFEIRVKSITMIPDVATMALMGARILRMDSQPLLSLEQSLWRPVNRLIKRSLDIIIGLLALPLVLTVILLSFPFLGGKPLMRIRRYDLGQKPMDLLQLRVDYIRGGWLFQSGLYKLPELLGVLAGTQSMVGPAPLIEREFDLYKRSLQSFSRLRPGLTGLWQVSDYGYFEPGQRLALDMYYAMNWTPLLDARIMVESFIKGLHSLIHPRKGRLRT